MNTIFIVIPILTVLMFDLGLTLTPRDFAALVRSPRPVLVGLLGQLVVLPAVAFAVAGLFGLSPLWRVGLVLIACCPGGSSSNVFARLAKGDVPLSVTLTAVSSIVTLLTIPIVLSLAVAGSNVSLPVGRLLVQNVALMLLPVLFGMALRRYRSEWAKAVDKVLSRCAFPGLVLLASIYFLQNREAILDNIDVLGPCVLTLLLVSISLGLLLALACGIRREQRRSIVIEIGMQNAAQAIAIAASPFVLNNSAYAVPAIIYALLMNVVLLAYVGLIKIKQ